MQRRRIGSHGFEVGAVGFHCGSAVPPTAGHPDEPGFVRTVHRALDLGVTLVDAGEPTGDSAALSALGRALTGRRDTVVLAVRSGLVADGRGVVATDGRPHQVRRSCDTALRRLRTDHVDLYQLSRIDPLVPLEDTWAAMADLVAAGKVRSLGIRGVGPAALRLIHGVFPVTAVQVPLNPWQRDALGTVLPWCRDRGVGLLATAPMGSGTSRGDPEDTVERVARRLGATPAQLAVAWTLAQGPQVVAVAPLRHPEQAAEFAAAARVPLPAHEVLAAVEPA